MPSLIKVATYSETCKTLESLIKNETGIPAVIRMGGTMDYSEYPIQINSKFSIQNSVNKLMLNMLMKGKDYILPFSASYGKGCGIFSSGNLLTPGIKDSVFISRPLGGSGGEEIIVVSVQDYVNNVEPYINNRIITPFIDVTSEYRFFCTNKEVFYIYKKIKKQAHKKDLFITRQNHIIRNIEETVKPRLLKEMKEAALEVMNTLGLELAALDIIYDSTNDKEHRFFIVETNTGPEMSNSEIKTAVSEKITQLINEKNK